MQGPASFTSRACALSVDGPAPGAAAAVAQGVVEEVSERLLEPQRVGSHHQPARSAREDLATGLARALGKALSQPLEALADVERLAADRQAAAIRSGERQQILCQQ